MGVLSWLFGKLDDSNKLAEQTRTIATLQQEVDALRRQELMNLGNREEINRLHREINNLKYGPTVKKQMAEMSYDDLLEEAKRRRKLKETEPAKPVQSIPQRVGRIYRQGSVPSYSSPSATSSNGGAYLAAGIAIGSAAVVSSTSSACSTSSDSGSSSSSDSGLSCDSGGGF